MSKIKCLDLRPHKIHLENVDFIIGDINKLPFNEDSINNISSLSVIEHIGLEDMEIILTYLEWKNLSKNFERVLKKNGNLIVSFPFGKKIL